MSRLLAIALRELGQQVTAHPSLLLLALAGLYLSGLVHIAADRAWSRCKQVWHRLNPLHCGEGGGGWETRVTLTDDASMDMEYTYDVERK